MLRWLYRWYMANHHITHNFFRRNAQSLQSHLPTEMFVSPHTPVHKIPPLARVQHARVQHGEEREVPHDLGQSLI